MDQYEFSDENNQSECDVFENPDNRKFRALNPESYVVMPFCLMLGEKLNTKLLCTKSEKQFYTFNDYSVNGRIYRCQNRKCPARVLLIPSGQCVKLSKQKEHNHEYNCDLKVKKLNALNAMKKKCADLRTVASGRRLAKVRDIYTQVMIE